MPLQFFCNVALDADAAARLDAPPSASDDIAYHVQTIVSDVDHNADVANSLFLNGIYVHERTDDVEDGNADPDDPTADEPQVAGDDEDLRSRFTWGKYRRDGKVDGDGGADGADQQQNKIKIGRAAKHPSIQSMYRRALGGYFINPNKSPADEALTQPNAVAFLASGTNDSYTTWSDIVDGTDIQNIWGTKDVYSDYDVEDGTTYRNETNASSIGTGLEGQIDAACMEPLVDFMASNGRLVDAPTSEFASDNDATKSKLHSLHLEDGDALHYTVAVHPYLLDPDHATNSVNNSGPVPPLSDLIRAKQFGYSAASAGADQDGITDTDRDGNKLGCPGEFRMRLTFQHAEPTPP